MMLYLENAFQEKFGDTTIPLTQENIHQAIQE